MRECPTHEEFAALLEEQVAGEARARVEAHLASCIRCAQTWAILLAETAERGELSSASTATEADAAEVAPGTRIGRYLVIDLVGAGGMGRVYRAYDPELNRNVALKLLRRTPGDRMLQRRFLREAQALAQVVHSNVVNVFDVGEFREQVFFAMELVEGATLRTELQRLALDRRRLLGLLDQSGRGLAAVHRAGLVHRDFKPENVLIDAGGKVKVADFGLAHVVSACAREEATVEERARPAVTLGPRITETGARIGTPAYMAPEQYEGHATDARADQFSFCVVAYEALFGHHPFLDGQGRLSVAAMQLGKVKAPVSRGEDAAYLQVLRRGLSPRPADRFPSLDRLLDELSQIPRRLIRRRLALAMAIGVIGAVMTTRLLENHHARSCEDEATRALAGIWDEARQARVEHALVHGQAANDRDLWKRIKAAFDGYAERWIRARAELCRSAPWWRAEREPARLYTSACLDERRRELRAAIDIFVSDDQDGVRLRALDIVYHLDPISTCTKTAMLAPTPRLGHDQVEDERIRDLLARSRTLVSSDKFEPAEAAAHEALAAARQLHDRALAAEALYDLGLSQQARGDLDGSEENLAQALAEAQGAGHERMLPRIWQALIISVGYTRGNFREAKRLIPLFEATAQHYDSNAIEYVDYLFTVALIESKHGRYEQAIAHFNEALERYRAGFSDSDERGIYLYTNLANTERAAGRLERGIEHARVALARTEALLGSEHPNVAVSLIVLSLMSAERGDAGAIAAARRALRIVEQYPDSGVWPFVLYGVGVTYLQDAQPLAALPYFHRAQAVEHGRQRGESVYTASLAEGIAEAEAALGNQPQARRGFQRALAAYTESEGAEHPFAIRCAVRLGELLLSQHRAADAQRVCAQARAAGEQALGPNHHDVAATLTCIGQADEALGHVPDALAVLEQAYAVREELPASRAATSFALARVLWRIGRDRERARRLAKQAVELYQHTGRLHAGDLLAARTWLKNVSSPVGP